MVNDGWHVYVVRCGDDSLYTGISTDVARRFAEHQAQGARTARYLRGRGPLVLAYVTQSVDQRTARQLEYRIKQLSRAEKLQLIAGQLQLEFTP
ncbi:MAG TPA: GIY-YIG nuclease family protein [Pseudohongiella sp.]|nr:hypothetical protein [Pseudohongiella sp.]HBX37217.1 GIY-YIG nuclease family protein [Pseudohongiella sp.]